jgi:hypothetical protein
LITPSGAVSLCEGGTRVLTAPFGQTYQWFRNGNVVNGAIAQVLEINEAGTYTVRVSNGACEVTSQPAVVSISQPPIATITFAGSTDLCVGDSRTLTSTPANAYQWFRNGQAIPGATNRNFVVTQSGNYSVELSNAAGCTTLSGDVSFNFTALPGNSIQANGATEFCAGGEVRLTAPQGGTYQWLRNGVAIPGAQSRDFVAISTGAYRVTVTNGGICAVTSEVMQVNVNPLPEAIITLNGIEMQAPQGDFNYQWYKNGAPITGATERTYLSFTSGSYQVRITARTGVGCSSLSPAFDFIVTDVNAPLPGQLQLKAFPNPVKDRLQLSIPKAISNQAPMVELWSSDGRLLQQIPSIDNGVLYQAEIEMGNYRQAQYLILVRGQRSTLRTWVIKH